MASLPDIEKKMEMSLDDIIKQNKSKAGSKAKGGKAAGPGAKAAAAGAPKVLKPGVAGKRQAIQQKKAAQGGKPAAAGAGAGKSPNKPGGVRVKAAKPGITLAKTAKGGVLKPGAAGNKGGGGLKQNMAKKILNKAKQQQGAPKALGAVAAAKRKANAAGQAKPAAVNVGKAGKAQAKPKIQFNSPGGANNKQKQQAPGPKAGAAPKSLAQQMNDKRKRGGKVVQAPKNLATGGGAQGKQAQGAQPKAGKRRAGVAVAPQKQLNRVAAGGVRKQPPPQQRAPLMMGQARHQQQGQGFAGNNGGVPGGLSKNARKKLAKQQQQQQQMQHYNHPPPQQQQYHQPPPQSAWAPPPQQGYRQAPAPYPQQQQQGGRGRRGGGNAGRLQAPIHVGGGQQGFRKGGYQMPPQQQAYQGGYQMPQEPQHHYMPAPQPAPISLNGGGGGGGGAAVSQHQMRQAALTALRLQQLDEAKQRAERAAFIHASMAMLAPVAGGRRSQF